MNRLREIRTKKKLSQGEVAQELGVKRVTYSKYETGDIAIKDEHLVTLSKFFGVSIDYILCLSESPAVATKENERIGPDDLTDDELKLIRRYRKLDEDGREIVLAKELEVIRSMITAG